MLQQIAKVMSSDPETIRLENRGRPVKASLDTLVGKIRGIEHGVMLNVEAVIVEKR